MGESAPRLRSGQVKRLKKNRHKGIRHKIAGGEWVNRQKGELGNRE
jgi:hypothetical protein